MKAFVLAALPWVSVGLALALTAVRQARGKKDVQNSYLVECLCLGVIWGGDGMCYGMLLGTALGCCIPKEKQNEQV